LNQRAAGNWAHRSGRIAAVLEGVQEACCTWLGGRDVFSRHGHCVTAAVLSTRHRLHARPGRQDHGPRWSNDAYGWRPLTANIGARTYSVNGLNEYTAATRTWSCGDDLDDRLTPAGKCGFVATLTYDALGRMRQTVLAGTKT
jgi:hypothetical protein